MPKDNNLHDGAGGACSSLNTAESKFFRQALLCLITIETLMDFPKSDITQFPDGIKQQAQNDWIKNNSIYLCRIVFCYVPQDPFDGLI